MEHIWTVACRESIIDSQSNNVSLINVLEQINFATPDDNPSESIVFFPFSSVIVSFWTRSNRNEPEKANTRILLLSPEAEELVQVEQMVDLTEYTRSRTIGRLEGMPFKENGVYKFVVQLQNDIEQWQTVATIPVEITRTVSDLDVVTS